MKFNGTDGLKAHIRAMDEMKLTTTKKDGINQEIYKGYNEACDAILYLIEQWEDAAENNEVVLEHKEPDWAYLSEQMKKNNVTSFENAKTKQFIKRFRENMEYQIRSAESLYTEAPQFLLDKFSKQMMDEHAGFIGGLKVSLNILDAITDEEDDEEETD
jgi:hypothetical protein